MRTIKFKGECNWLEDYSNKTVCGSLLQMPDGSVRILEHDYGSKFNYFSVDPDTVCQFTGFLDKNGKEIYEGDVLRSNEYPYSCAQDDERDNYYAVVYYCEEGACFGIVMAKNPDSDVRGISDGIPGDVGREKMKKFEVVGNIHDKEWKQYGEYFRTKEETEAKQ